MSFHQVSVKFSFGVEADSEREARSKAVDELCKWRDMIRENGGFTGVSSSRPGDKTGPFVSIEYDGQPKVEA